jgi:hypothetical protein
MIEVVGWEKHQHYKKRTPPWIKLHRKLLANPVFLRSSGDAVKVINVVWLVASENGGVVEKSPADLAFIYHLQEDALAESLIYWHNNDFLKCASNVLAWCKRSACLETETEAEAEAEAERETEAESLDEKTTNRAGTPNEPATRTSAEGKYSVRLPDSVLRAEALEGMGLGQYRSVPDVTRISRELQEMIHTIDRENLMAAMRGFTELRDAGEVGLTKGKGYTPGILLRWGKGGIWWGEGDQRTQRNFLDLCQEIGRRDKKRPAKRGGMDSTGNVLASIMGGAA